MLKTLTGVVVFLSLFRPVCYVEESELYGDSLHVGFSNKHFEAGIMFTEFCPNGRYWEMYQVHRSN